MSNLFRDNLYNEFPDPNKKINELGESLSQTQGDISNLAKRNSRVSVLEHGATGGGVLDDLPAIRAAYQVAVENKLPLYFPSGYTFYVSNTFEITNDDVAVIGDGSFYNGAIITNKNGNYATVRFKGANANAYIRRNMMSNLRIYGQLHAYNCVDFWLDNVFVHYGHTHTFVVEGGWSFKFQGCQFQYAKNGYNVYLTTDPLTTFREVNALYFSSCRVEAGTGGIGAEPNTEVKSLSFDGGIIEGHQGAFAWGVNIPRGNSLTFNTVYFEGNEKGNGIFGAAASSVKNLVFKGVQNHGFGDGMLAQRPPYGINCVNVQGGEIFGDSRGFRGAGVIVDTYCVDVKVGGSEYINSTETNLPVTRLGKANKSSLFNINVARNGNFSNWLNGMPTNYLKNAGTETVTQESTVTNGFPYSVKISNVDSSAGGLLQRYTNLYPQLKGRSVYVMATAKTSISGRVRIRVSDGVNSSYSSTHLGDDSWRTLSVKHDISENATSLNVILETVSGTVVDAYWANYRIVVDGDFSGNLGVSNPSDYYSNFSGTVNTVGTPPTATVTHNLDNNGYVVAVTPSALVKYKVTKNTTNFVIETETACSVDWVIVKSQ